MKEINSEQFDWFFH